MKKITLMLISIMLLTIPIMNVEAAGKFNIYVFYGQTCSYCHNLFDFLSELEDDPNYNHMFEVQGYEVWGSYKNEDLGKEVAAAYGDNFQSVPYYIIGDKSFTGFTESFEDDIKYQIVQAYTNSYVDKATPIIKKNSTTTTKKKINTTTTTVTTTSKAASGGYLTTSKKVTTSKTTERTYQTTIKGTTVTTTSRPIIPTIVPVTSQTSTNIYQDTTTKPEISNDELPKDKNGQTPEDVINDFFKLLNDNDEKALDYMAKELKDMITQEEFNFDEETSALPTINGYVHYPAGTIVDEETYDYDIYRFNVTAIGTLFGREIDNYGDEDSYIDIILEDGEYKILTMDLPIELRPGDFITIFKQLFAMINEETGGFGILFVILIIVVLILSCMPFIIFITVIVLIIKTISKASRQRREMNESGVLPPNNNGQGM